MRVSIATAVLTSLTLLAAQASGGPISYVYNAGSRSHMRSNGSIDEVVRIAKRWSGAFLWARVDGRAYLIRDAGVLDAARRAFARLDRLELRLEEAKRRLRPFERHVESIEQRADGLSDSLDDKGLSEAERERIQARLQKLEEERRSAKAKAYEAETALEELERQQEEQERIAEKELERIIVDAIRAGRSVRAD